MCEVDSWQLCCVALALTRDIHSFKVVLERAAFHLPLKDHEALFEPAWSHALGDSRVDREPHIGRAVLHGCVSRRGGRWAIGCQRPHARSPSCRRQASP